MECPQCGFENAVHLKFCVECGLRLIQACGECSAEVLPTYKFCGECGAALRGALGVPPASVRPVSTRTSATRAPATRAPKVSATLAEAGPAPAAPAVATAAGLGDGEHRQVTVLVCELVAVEPDGGPLPSDLVHLFLNRLTELGRVEVERFGGSVHRFLDKGFMALFGAPVALEDHARRAVLAAVGLQQQMNEQAAEAEDSHGVRWSARFGIDTGPVVVGALGTLVGEPTTVAMRLQQVARPSQVLVSDATSRWVHEQFELVLVEDVSSETGPVWRVLSGGSPPGARRLLESTQGPFVGRERELAILEDLRDLAAGAKGQVVGIAGDAGSGKSRLLNEFYRRTFPGRRVSYLRGQCLSYGSAVPYLPLMDMIRQASKITPTDSPEETAVKLRQSLAAVGTDAELVLPFLLSLLGISEGAEALSDLEPQAIQSRTFAAMRRMILDASQKALVVVEIEDVQWIDETSEQFFASLVEVLGAAGILLLLTYRSGYQPRWLEKSYANQINIRQLSEEDSRQLIYQILDGDELSEERLQEVLAKAEGNPLFLEELARSLADESTGDAVVPDTIQGILAARIDRLPDAHKLLLRTAAVLGREFSLELLDTLWDQGEIDELLEDLCRWEVIYKVPAEGDPRFFFKHTLTQEVVYGSVLKHRRRELHRQAAEVLEKEYAGHLEEAYDRLIYHYPRAGEPAKTVHYLTLFAQRAASSYAHAEASKALREALVQAEDLDQEVRDRRLTEVLLQLAESLLPLADFPGTLELCQRYAERVQSLGDPALNAQYYFWLSHTYTYLGNQEETRRNAQLAIDAARECGDETTEGKASYVLGRDGFWSGRFQKGIEASLRAVILLERSGEPWWQGQAYWVAGFNHYVLGQLEKGIRALERTCSIGEALDDYRLDASWSMGYFYACLGEGAAGVEQCQRGVERAQDPLNTAVALGFLGYAQLKSGDVTAAMTTLSDSVDRLQQTGMQQILGWFSVFLGEARLVAGEHEQAREAAVSGREMCREARFHYGVALAHHTLGRVDLAAGDLASAAEHFHTALEDFKTLEVPFEKARVHLDMARRARAADLVEESVRELASAHRVFEELHVPRYVERTIALGEAWDVALDVA